MNNKTFHKVIALVFGIVAIAHGWRYLSGTQAIIGSWNVPLSVSLVAIIVAGSLSYRSYKLAK